MLKLKRLTEILAVICALMLLFGCAAPKDNNSSTVMSSVGGQIAPYSGSPYTELNDNTPEFTKDEITTVSFERYSPLDSFGRCGVAIACVGQDIMPTEERGSIGQVKPAGWHLVKYDVVDGKYLYNRCHLIGYQLTGENANKQNLITGTRYLNVAGMLPFENEIADYVKSTDNHVIYRVTPIYSGDNLIADGVQMEAFSVEDDGKGISFNIYCYNVQPGVVIDYLTGDSHLSGEAPSSSNAEGDEITFVINKGTKKFHLPECESVTEMKPQNRKNHYGDREALIESGYIPCSRCDA